MRTTDAQYYSVNEMSTKHCVNMMIDKKMRLCGFNIHGGIRLGLSIGRLRRFPGFKS